MKRVIIESPFAGDVEANTAYLKKAILHSLSRGESPYASHGFFTHFLDDTIAEERKTGILAGLAWSSAAEQVIYYLDRGMSGGMRFALEKHTQANRDIKIRLIDNDDPFITFDYINWRGESAQRHVRFKRFFWGSTKYHKRDQVFLEGMCRDRGELRQFAVADITFLNYPLAVK